MGASTAQEERQVRSAFELTQSAQVSQISYKSSLVFSLSFFVIIPVYAQLSMPDNVVQVEVEVRLEMTAAKAQRRG